VLSQHRKWTTRAFKRAMDEPCTLPLSFPKGGTKRDFAVFASKIQLMSNNVCYKVFSVKTSSRKVVATSLLHMMVHRRIADDVPIYLEFALKVTHFFRKRGFRQISLNSASTVRASKKR